MTAIAAFRVHGYPALVADMLLSRPDGEGRWQALPTNPEAYEALADTLAASFGGLQRKLQIVNHRVAVAWAGSEFWAQSVCRMVGVRFKDAVPAQTQLLDALQQIGIPQDRGSLTILIGWVLEPQPYCFRWSSAEPSRLDIAESHYDGTGKAVIEAAMVAGEHLGFATGKKSFDARRGVAAAVAHVVCEELEVGESLRDLFGFAYDMVVEHDGRFEYLPSILFAHFDVECTLDRRATRITLPRRMLRWSNHQSVAAVQVAQFNRAVAPVSRTEDVLVEDVANVLVAPTYWSRPFDGPPPADQHPMDVDWIALSCSIVAPDLAAGVCWVQDARSAGPFRIRAQGSAFSWDCDTPQLNRMIDRALAPSLAQTPAARGRGLGRWKGLVDYLRQLFQGKY